MFLDACNGINEFHGRNIKDYIYMAYEISLSAEIECPPV